MRVLFDGRVTGNDGIGRYVKNISLRLAKISEIEISCISRNNIFEKLISNIIYDDSTHYTYNEILIIDELISSLKPDIMHCTDYRVPFNKNNTSLIVSIHDIFRYTDPSLCYDNNEFVKKYGVATLNEMMKVTNVLNRCIKHDRVDYIKYLKAGSAHFDYYQHMLIWAIASSDILLTPSHFVKNEIMANFEPEKTICVNHYGINHLALDCTDKSKLPEMIAVTKKPYFLYVGQYRKHKNVETILEALKLTLVKKNANVFFVGNDFSDNNELTNLIRLLGLSDNVRMIGYLPDEKLYNAYSKSCGLLHLSMHEGFGFTPLEAMSCGCPVVVSDTQIHRETLGELGIYVETRDAIQISNEMIKLLCDSNTKRETYVKHAQNFIWEKTITSLIDFYGIANKKENGGY